MAIFTAVATAIGTAIGLGSFGVSLLAAGLSTGAQFLLQKYVNRPKKRTYAAFKSEREFGGDVPRQGNFGVTAQRGHYVRYFKWGAGDAFNADVIILSDGWCDGLEPFIILDGKRVNLITKPLIGSEIQHFGIEGFETLTSIRYYDGRPGQQADAKLIADTGGDPSTDPADNIAGRFNGSDKGTNMAYVIFERQYSSAWEREPDPVWMHRGLRCHDSREAGHDANDPSTWAFTKNPAVQRVTYLIGAVRGVLSGRVMLGMGKPLSHIDVASHIVAANVADEQRQAGGGTINRYETNIIVQGDDDHSEMLKEFDDGLAGYGVNRNGLASIVVGAPQVPVFDITDDDIMIESDIVHTPRRPSDELYNHLTGQFTSIESLFEPESLTPVRVNADFAADKQINQTSYDFLQVTDPDIAQYLLNIRYRQNRKGGSASFALPLSKAFQLNAGDWVTWRGATWMVASKDGPQISLQETGADIYLEAGIAPGPVVVPPAVPVNPSVLSTVEGFAVEVGAVQGAGDVQSPSLRFSWTPPDDPTITDVVIKYWSTANPSQTFTAVQPAPEAGELITTANVEPGRIYRAQATIVTVPDRFRTFTANVTTASATPARTLELDLAQVRDAVEEPLRRHFNDIESIQIELGRLALAQLGVDVQSEAFRQELKTRVGDAEASIVEERETRVSETGALAVTSLVLQATLGNVSTALSEESATRATETEALTQQATTLSTEIDDLEAAVVDESAARTNGDNAISQQITTTRAALEGDINANATATNALQTQVTTIDGQVAVNTNAVQSVRAELEGAFAEGLVEFEAVAGPTGVAARLAVRVRSAVSGNFVESGIFIDVFPDQTTQIVMLADRFVLTDGSDENLPFVFENGRARLNVVDAGTINAGLFDLREPGAGILG
ncbi:MAG: phage tail protein [Pseudomonadota bacterium]